MEAEAKLVIAKFHIGQITNDDACSEATRLGELSPRERLVAELWLALGDHEKAKHHATSAYQWAWADGEPYVYRYELTKTAELLQRLNGTIPKLSPYGPDKDNKLPWEDEVREAVEILRATKAFKKKRKNKDE